MHDITHLVPSFQATTQGDHGVITMTMRGIGNDSAKTEYADPEVALFVDGVYAPRAEGGRGLLFDLESVEVLRGPQGTLWGRNSTVGAVNIQTAKPDLAATSATSQVGLGNYNHFGARAAFNMPLSDTLRAARRLRARAARRLRRLPESESSSCRSVASQQAAYTGQPAATAATFQPINPNIFVTGGQKYNAQDQTAARLSLLWKPNARLHVERVVREVPRPRHAQHEPDADAARGPGSSGRR